MIDLNCDLGERAESIADGTDDALMAAVSSANIACGGHAGDTSTMETSIRSALRHGTAIGAHPGYADRARFGRVAQDLPAREIERIVEAQIRSLASIAAKLHARVGHVKPHGALYHAAMADPVVAEAVARAALRVDRSLVLVGLASSPTIARWRAMGLAAVEEAFADRRYEPGGGLRGREHANALVSSPAEAAEQALRIASGHGVLSWDGVPVPIHADTICIHGDTPGAPAVAREVRARLETAGFRIGALGKG